MPSNNDPIIMPDLGKMFNLDCFHFNEIKDTLTSIFEHLMLFDNRFNEVEARLNNIPNFSKIMQRLVELEDKIPLIDQKCDETGEMVLSVKSSLEKLIYKEKARGDNFDIRINDLMYEVELLKNK